MDFPFSLFVWGFYLMAFGLAVSAFNAFKIGYYYRGWVYVFAALSYGLGGLFAYGIHSWWPFVGGFVLAGILKYFTNDAGERKEVIINTPDEPEEQQKYFALAIDEQLANFPKDKMVPQTEFVKMFVIAQMASGVSDDYAESYYAHFLDYIESKGYRVEKLQSNKIEARWYFNLDKMKMHEVMHECNMAGYTSEQRIRILKKWKEAQLTTD